MRATITKPALILEAGGPSADDVDGRSGRVTCVVDDETLAVRSGNVAVPCIDHVRPHLEEELRRVVEVAALSIRRATTANLSTPKMGEYGYG